MTSKSISKHWIRKLVEKHNWILIPLKLNTKKPLIRWGHLRNLDLSHEIRLQIVDQFASHNVDWAVLTGRQSGCMVLDFDAPPYLDDEYVYTTTPSGGRHYYFSFTEGDSHGLNVQPKLDIPWIVKLYDKPVLNHQRMPINGPLPDQLQPVSTSWPGNNRRPSQADLNNCSFALFFREKRNDPGWDGRYPLARAYVASSSRLDNPDLDLGAGYRHTRQIIDNIGPPISCAQIVNSGFQCPYFDSLTKMCTKRSDVVNPLQLAMRYARDREEPADEI